MENSRKKGCWKKSSAPMNYSYQKFISDKLDIEFTRESINRARFSIAFQ